MLILSVVFNVVFVGVLVYLAFVLRKQVNVIVEKKLEVKTEHEQRDYWFQKHNKIRERLLNVASEVKDIELAWVRKLTGTHTAFNKLTAIVMKMANDEFRDQYIFSVTEMKEKHEQEAKERIAQDKLDVARKKANEIDKKTPDLPESLTKPAFDTADPPGRLP